MSRALMLGLSALALALANTRNSVRAMAREMGYCGGNTVVPKGTFSRCKFGATKAQARSVAFCKRAGIDQARCVVTAQVRAANPKHAFKFLSAPAKRGVLLRQAIAGQSVQPQA